MQKEKDGGCHCGKICYRLKGDLRPVIFCHCSDCMRLGGIVSATAVSDVTDCLIEDSSCLVWYQSSNDAMRGFCSYCGTHLFYRHKKGGISIMAGTLDSHDGLDCGGEIYAQNTPGWNLLAGHIKQLSPEELR